MQALEIREMMQRQ